ncbi:GLPGLI family protein [Empedobacter stercoris]|uniref:GLPGLI family protein n=1 Tax=Empedobacter stercoris TaxID=1628248 RepID=UPI0016625578|nr:GLPGLI family protein [Empedobacter stercoris]MCA4808214.1 GLPGLI family protein [Empedobacter stercoris]QNT14357.1 GLPGLI family protein [Empedobacter stercoris]
MKHLLLSGFLLFSSLGFAQEQLIVEYKYDIKHDEEKMKEFERELAQKGGGTIKIGGGPNIYYQLEYNDYQSIYKKIETINNDQNATMGSFTFNIGGEYKALTNEINKKEFRQEVVLDKQNYIVVTPHKDYQWKITDIEDTILGYKVVKAVGNDENKKIAAWFAPDIKVDAGPNQVNGLPGLILKTVSEMGNKFSSIMTYEADKINLKPKKLSKVKPINGKEISQEEFKKLQDESRQKMRESFSTGVDKK